jgi:aryl-alcohol dehydrogenase-like predicted oxidoreductase
MLKVGANVRAMRMEAKSNLMKMNPLGSSTLKVSHIALGTMTFGEQNTEAQAHRQLDFAVERGINLVDTAEMYPVMAKAETQGKTEAYIGSWLKSSARRDRVVLATKVAGPTRDLHWIRGGKGDLDAPNIRLALEDSLRRLQTDYVDLYQLHWPSRNVPIFGQKVFSPQFERPSIAIAETLEALAELMREGKVRAIGVSNETPWGVCEFKREAKARGLPAIVSIQNAYHLMNRSFEQGLVETCFRENVGLLAYSPLAFGRLTGKYLDPACKSGRLNYFSQNWSPRYMRPDVIAASERYAALARDHGLTPTQMALAWCYSRWFVTSTIIGATTIEQLEENINAAATVLRPELEAAIDMIHAATANPAL